MKKNNVWTDLNKVLFKHKTTLAELYWSQALEDHFSCFADYFVPLSDEDTKSIVDSLLNDDEMWNEIDYAMEWYANHLPNRAYLTKEDN